MLAHYSHFRIEAKRKALDALAEGTKSKGYVTKQMERAILNWQPAERNGGDDGTRTGGLCRDSLGIHGLSATWILSGGCQVAERDCRNRSLWVSLWVRISRLECFSPGNHSM